MIMCSFLYGEVKENMTQPFSNHCLASQKDVINFICLEMSDLVLVHFLKI